MNKIIDLKNDKGLIVLDRDMNIKGLVEKEHETLKKYLDEKDPHRLMRDTNPYANEWNLDYKTEYMLVGKCSVKDLNEQTHVLKFKMYLIDIDYYKDEEKEGFVFDLNKTKRRFMLEDGKIYSPTMLYNSNSFKIEEIELSIPNQEQLKMMFKDFKLDFDVKDFDIFCIEDRTNDRYIAIKEAKERFPVAWDFDGDVVYDKEGEYYINVMQQTVRRLDDKLHDGFKNYLVNSKRREFIAGVYYGDNRKCEESAM